MCWSRNSTAYLLEHPQYLSITKEGCTGNFGIIDSRSNFCENFAPVTWVNFFRQLRHMLPSVEPNAPVSWAICSVSWAICSISWVICFPASGYVLLSVAIFGTASYSYIQGYKCMYIENNKYAEINLTKNKNQPIVGTIMSTSAQYNAISKNTFGGFLMLVGEVAIHLNQIFFLFL